VTRAFAIQVCASQSGCFVRNPGLCVSVIAAHDLRPKLRGVWPSLRQPAKSSDLRVCMVSRLEHVSQFFPPPSPDKQ